jgi:hypothetical protein
MSNADSTRAGIVRTREQLVCPRTVESTLDQHLRCRRELEELERLTRTPRRGAQHEVRTNTCALEVLTDEPRGASTASVEGSIMVGESRICPARLGVPHQRELFGFHRADEPIRNS